MGAGARFRSGTAISGWTRRPTAGIGYGVATGGIGAAQSTGTLGDGFTYNYLTFTATGTLTVTKAGLFDVLMFGGGGAGGNQSAEQSGGGGGGAGWRLATVYLTTNTSIVVGAGADASLSTSVGGVGSPSYTDNMLMALGGGTGGMYDYGRYNQHTGNGGGQNTNGNFGSTAWANGYNGGNRSGVWDFYRAAGGGGGAGGVGGDASNSGGAYGGAGGAGYDVSTFIGGSALFKAAGGGGGGAQGGGAGGSGVGGAGGARSVGGSAAGANTAAGGGGCGQFLTTSYNIGGSGGSGIVYVRFRV